MPTAERSRNDKLKALEKVADKVLRDNLPEYLLRSAFDKQAAFIVDPARLKAALCTRRAGKSYMAALYCLIEGFRYPGVSILYLGLTKDAAKRVMVKDGFQRIFREHGLKEDQDYTLKLHSGIIELSNGSLIYLSGADQDFKQRDRILGQKYKLIIIDECQSWQQDLKSIIFDTLKPTTWDLDGTIVMIGTPSVLIATAKLPIFYAATDNKLTESDFPWSVHKWSVRDNPKKDPNSELTMAQAYEKELDLVEKHNPLYKETPEYSANYLGKWYLDYDRLAYKFNPDRNETRTLPDADEYYYVMGIDLGWNDPTAFVVCAYSRYDKTLYIVDTYKSSKMYVSDVADKISEFKLKYPIHTIVADNASKQVVEEIKHRYQYHIIAAEKQDKHRYIELMNSDLITAKVKLLDKKCEELKDEWRSLVWDTRKEKVIELASRDNHLSDAALYAWRYSYNYAAQDRPVKVEKNDELYIDRWAKDMEAKQKAKSQQSLTEQLFGDEFK